MSKETIAQALALGGQDAALPVGWDGEESIGLRLIRDAAVLREELAHLRQDAALLRKAVLRTELALHKANHENDELRAKVSYWRAQAMNPPALRPLADRRPLMLTDRGDAGDGYGAFYDSD